MTPLLQVKGLSKRFGGFVALDGIDLDVAPGRAAWPHRPQRLGQEHARQLHLRHAAERDRHGAASTARSLNGAPAHKRTHLGLARSFQLPRPFASMTVADNIRVPLLYTVRRRTGLVHSAKDLDHRCLELLALVGLEHLAERWPRDLSQVEMRKLELARAVASEPKLLIADEAMAGLSHSEVEDIVQLLLRLNKEQGITVILIEHIMRAVMAFSQRIAVLVSGRKIADGKPDDIVNNPEVVSAYLGQ